ncbi:hypothetical protein D3C80_834440 [compost metagenome]
MRMAADHLRGDGLNHVAKGEFTPFLGNAGVENHLQEKVAQFLAKIVHVLALDGVGDFISFFNGIGLDRLEGLHNIPRATGFRLAQGFHDLDQAGNILRGFHMSQTFVLRFFAHYPDGKPPGRALIQRNVVTAF